MTKKQFFSCFYMFRLFLPAFELWEILPHHLYVFLFGDGLGHVFVHLVHELGAEVDHLVHGAVVGESPVLVAVEAVILVAASVGVGAEHLFGERHTAALANFGSILWLVLSVVL